MEEMGYVYGFLYDFPLWGLFLLLISLAISVLLITRGKWEKVNYNFSICSSIGDSFLIAAILMATEILKRDGVVPEFCNLPEYQLAWLIISIMAGLTLAARGHLISGKWGKGTDLYHNLFIVPMFIFLLATTYPITYYQGSPQEKLSALLLLIAWLLTLLFDLATGRLDQRSWARKKDLSSHFQD